MKYLNVGCGNRFHPDWVNVDLSPIDKRVITHDLSTGIPFDDNSFDAVYHSHLLEHIPRHQGKIFIRMLSGSKTPRNFDSHSSRSRINYSNLPARIRKSYLGFCGMAS